MEKAKAISELVKNLTLLTQLGLSLVTPLLMCLGISWWLTSRFGLGGWVYIPAFLFGLGGMFSVGMKLSQTILSRYKKEKEEKKQPLSFNRHL